MSTSPDQATFPPGLTVLRFDAPAAGHALLPGTRMVQETDRAALLELINEMHAEPKRAYIVDLTGASKCGTPRLGLLIRLHQQLRVNGRVLRLAVDHPELSEIFRLTRLNTILAVFTSLQAAIEEARQQP